MKTIAIDPGPTESAFVVYDDGEIVNFGKEPNDRLIECVMSPVSMWGASGAMIDRLVIEMIASYGMPVGREVFDTCVWIGRFIQAWRGQHETIYRGTVKLHLCNSVKAKDGNVRQALIDRFGGDSHAIGKKAKPGPLYGVSGDVWAALAVAVTYAERMQEAQVAA